MKTFSDKAECLKVAAIKGVEFLLEYLGCSLGQEFLPNLLQTITQTYPISYLSEDDQENFNHLESLDQSETNTPNKMNNGRLRRSDRQSSNNNNIAAAYNNNYNPLQNNN